MQGNRINSRTKKIETFCKFRSFCLPLCYEFHFDKSMETFTIKALQLILSLSILVIMHELGHFVFAKIFKVRIEKFYLFFNPRFSIFRMKKINGEWHFKWFSKNDNNIRRRYNYEGKEIAEIIPAEQLPDNNWKKYPDTMEWGIGWLPFGGYVKIAGMVDE